MDSNGRTCFAEQLADLRSQAGLSLADVATAAHVARGYVHHIEHGRRWPTQSVAKALDTALGADGALLASQRPGAGPGEGRPGRRRPRSAGTCS
ncbi:MAG TPA: helix-turn-helix transcriptional regulator [Pseudonocardiaceae bacterium]|nr:helix-turn-helix transcriptional regulator [Pseudonocardiaceae bacterium]